MKTLTLVCAALSFLAGAAATTTAAEKETDISLQTEFGRIVRADSWLDRKVFGQQGKLVGETKDLAFDLETGHLALVLVKLRGLDEKMPGHLAVPPATLRQTDKGLQFRKNIQDSRLATADRLPESAYHKELNRGWAAQQYETFQQQPYWVRRVKVKDKKQQAKSSERHPVDKKYLLTLASTVKNKQVQGQDGQTLGTIQGFAVAPQSGQIVYAAVKLKEGGDKLYPIPLGAFLVGDAAKPWTIDLDRKIVANTPSFAAGRWPSEVQRGWIEYVHVRYGQAAIGGVQHKE